MAWTKTFNLAVKAGTYTLNGETKFRYKTIGKVLENSDTGKELFIIERTFNPAGALQDGGDGVVLYCFEPNERDNKSEGGPPNARPLTKEEVDDIPF